MDIKIRNEILMEVVDNLKINRFIKRYVAEHYINDFKSHLYLQILQMDYKNLLKAKKEGYLIKLVTTIIKNQYLSKTSSFWKIYRNNGFYKEVQVDPIIVTIDDQDDNKDMKYNSYIELIDKLKTTEEDNIDTIFKDVDDLLNHRHYYHSYLFKLYYIEGLTYQAIEKKTGIPWETARYSIIKTLEWIKTKMSV